MNARILRIRISKTLAILAIGVLLLPGLPAAGQTSPGVSPATKHLPAETLPPEQAIRLALAQGLAYLPTTVTGDKDWGKKTRVWSGIDWDWSDKHRLFGGKLRTHRRYRDVNHGRWVRYELTLPEPAYWTDKTTGKRTAGQPHADDAVQVHSVSPHPGADGRYRMRIGIDAPVGFTVRVQRHVRGVRLHSVTVVGRCSVAADVDVGMGVLNDWSEIPPAVVLDPIVHQAKLKLQRFEVDRISHVGGDAAEAWGEVAQETIVRLALEKLNDNLTDRLNRQIKRKRSQLRFSTRDVIAETWSFDQSTTP